MKQGECINSEFLTVVPVSDVGECITALSASFTPLGERCSATTTHSMMTPRWGKILQPVFVPIKLFFASPAFCTRTAKSLEQRVPPVFLEQFQAAATLKV